MKTVNPVALFRINDLIASNQCNKYYSLTKPCPWARFMVDGDPPAEKPSWSDVYKNNE